MSAALATTAATGANSNSAEVGAAGYLFSDDPLGIGISPYLLQRKRHQSAGAWDKMVFDLSESTTLYVGNLSFYTTEEQIYELFSRCGRVKRVIMGLNK